MEIHGLHQQGGSIRRIAKDLGISRNTVRTYLRDKSKAPVYPERQSRPTKLQPYHDYLRGRLIPPREGAAFWEQEHPRNLAVGCQKLCGSNKKWKKRYGYHKHSLSETATYRVKQLLDGKLSLRNNNAQVSETYAMLKALNKLTELGMLKTQCVV